MREQKANDNGFPVVGKQVKEQQAFPFDELIQYNGATNTIKVNANLDIQGEVKQENAIVFENVDLSNGSTQKANTGANWAIMSDPSADVILQLYLTEQAVYPLGDVVELARISTSDNEVVFGGNFDYGNGDGYINYTITARCNANTVVISITETEANKGNVPGDAPYLSDLTLGGNTYKVFDGQMGEIVDLDNNFRFVEGNGTPISQAGVNITYNKYSLSGTHLMIVVAGTINGGTTITGFSRFSTFALPNYIYNKINVFFGSVTIDLKAITFYSSNGATTEIHDALLIKPIGENNVAVVSRTDFTTSDTRVFRIQFDLLIDAS